MPNDFMLLVDRMARLPISTIVMFGLALTVFRVAIYPYLSKTPFHKRGGLYSFVRFVNDLSDALIYAAIVVFLLVRPFGIQTFYIPSPSMVDTLRVNDYIVANKWIYRTSDPQFGDIVVFKPPQGALREGMPESDFIKRCLGVPGDLIEIRDWEVFRNGEKVEEPYKVVSDPLQRFLAPLPREDWPAYTEDMPDFKLVEWEGRVIPLLYRDEPGGGVSVNTGESLFPIDLTLWSTVRNLPPAKVPEGMYLMVGDNRNGSNDSRYWGLVPRESIVGKAEFTWMPIGRATRLANPHAR